VINSAKVEVEHAKVIGSSAASKFLAAERVPGHRRIEQK